MNIENNKDWIKKIGLNKKIEWNINDWILNERLDWMKYKWLNIEWKIALNEILKMFTQKRLHWMKKSWLNIATEWPAYSGFLTCFYFLAKSEPRILIKKSVYTQFIKYEIFKHKQNSVFHVFKHILRSDGVDETIWMKPCRVPIHCRRESVRYLERFLKGASTCFWLWTILFSGCLI